MTWVIFKVTYPTPVMIYVFSLNRDRAMKDRWSKNCEVNEKKKRNIKKKTLRLRSFSSHQLEMRAETSHSSTQCRHTKQPVWSMQQCPISPHSLRPGLCYRWSLELCKNHKCWYNSWRLFMPCRQSAAESSDHTSDGMQVPSAEH